MRVVLYVLSIFLAFLGGLLVGMSYRGVILNVREALRETYLSGIEWFANLAHSQNLSLPIIVILSILFVDLGIGTWMVLKEALRWGREVMAARWEVILTIVKWLPLAGIVPPIRLVELVVKWLREPVYKE